MINKTVIVFGATGGLGYSCAKIFASHGYDLILTGRNSQKLENAKKALSDIFGCEITALTLDFTELNEALKSIDRISNTKKNIVAAVNTIGALGHDFDTINETNWDDVLNINLKAPFFISLAIGKKMALNKAGSIVNIASTTAHYGGKPDYSASKAGILSITKSLAKELAQFNVRVNAVTPGYIETEMTNWDASKKEKKIKNVPLGRIATSDEIANVVYFLCTNNASFITGASIDVNGGMLLR